MEYLFIDADDTLWENEAKFRSGERRFTGLVNSFRKAAGAAEMDPEEILDILERHIEDNLPVVGYGARSMLVSMVETSLAGLAGGHSITEEYYRELRGIHDSIADTPVEVFPEVPQTLERLSSRFRLVLATKGDLIEQKRKIRASGLERWFFHTEVMENKDSAAYLRLARLFGVRPEDFVMTGNSLRSDIVPVLEMGGTAIYIPHHIVWRHEVCEEPVSEKMIKLSRFSDLARYWQLP